MSHNVLNQMFASSRPAETSGDPGQDEVGGDLGVHVGVHRGLDGPADAAGRVHQLRHVELVAGGDGHQQPGTQQADVRPDRGGEVEGPAGRRDGVGRHRQTSDHGQGEDRPALDEAPERQVEDIEADVAAEGGIGRAELPAVEEEQQGLPVPAPGERAEQPADQGQGDEHDPHRARDVRHLDRSDPPNRDLGPEATRDPQADQGGDREQHESDHEPAEVGGEASQQDVATAEAAVPGEVGEQLDQAAEDLEHDERADEEQDRADPVAGRPVRSASARSEPTGRRGPVPAILIVGNLLLGRPDRGTRRQRTALAGVVLLHLAPLHLFEQLVEPRGHRSRASYGGSVTPTRWWPAAWS